MWDKRHHDETQLRHPLQTSYFTTCSYVQVRGNIWRLLQTERAALCNSALSYSTFAPTDLFFLFLVWWFCNPSKILPLRHFLFVFVCSFILNAYLSLIFVFVLFFGDLFLLWAVLAICYVWIYLSDAVTFSCQFWFQPTALVQQWERSCVVTLQLCGISSGVWCPEECPNNVLAKAGKLTHLSTSLTGQCFGRHPVPSFANSFTTGSVVLTWNFFDFCVWHHLAHILKSKKNPHKNKDTLP